MSRGCRLFVSAVLAFIPVLGSAQFAEQNVNMVAGTSWPHGDPYLQRQNEPSVAVSTRNFLNVIALANDYRSVDIPFDAPVGVDSEERGDAWIGVFKSRNGGQTWWSDLLDGFPQQANSTSPLHGFQAAADPVVRSGPNGMFYASGIVLNRTLNPLGAVFVTRFIDNNNTENGDPIQNLGAKIIDQGTSGQFLDKPWIAVGPGTGTCTVSGQTFAAQNVYVAYTAFVGGDNNIRTKLMFARSTDCGATWSSPQKLSEGYPINQGASIVVAPTAIYVVWRQFKSQNIPDAILIAKSTDNGQTFTKAATIRNITPFEQGTVALPSQPAIRTNAYPAAAADASGRLYVVWADRGFQANGDGRIMMVHSADGVSWSGPIVVDGQSGRGHQFMPSVSVAGGKIVVAYYDLRDDSTMGVFTKLGGGLYSESRVAVGDRPVHPELVFSQYLQEYANEQRRHTLDLRGAMMTASAMGPVNNGITRLSRYIFGSRPNSAVIEQMQYNVPNFPIFRLGTAPFLGDYIDIAGYSPKSSPVWHAVWTDNRDVRPPLDGNWANYTPVFSPSNNGTSKFNGQAVPPCVGGQTGMRNHNIYTTRLTEGVFVGSSGNSKPLGTIQRAFTVFVQNAKGQAKSYRLTATPSSGIASFDQLLPNLPSVDVPVQAHSTATRTVYVTSQDHHATVTVDATEIDSNGHVVPGGLSSSAILNPDVSNPDVSNPDVSNPDVSNPDVSNPDVSNPDVSNSEVHNPDVSNPDVSNPDVSNPDVSNPDVSNPDVSNPDVSNPDVSNPDVSNPDVSNPDVSNPDVSNSALGDATDYTWKTHNKGNTTSGYSVKLAANSPLPVCVEGQVIPGCIATQLIVYRVYQTPIASSCNLSQEKHSQILGNVINPKFVTINDITSIDPNDASLWLNPGDGARITLRVYAKQTVFDPTTTIAPAVVSQAKNNINGVIAPSPSIALPASLPLFITTQTVNDAVVGQPYTTTFAATGGTAPYTWVSLAPQAAQIDPNGVMTYGGFATSGKSVMTISATDSAAHPSTATRDFVVSVYDPLQITTPVVLPDGQLNQAYTAPLAATGGKPPYAWSKYKPLSFPAWLSVDPVNGTLTGTPTVPGTYTVNVQVDDSAQPNQNSLRQFQLTVLNQLNVQWGPQPVTSQAGQSMFVGFRVSDINDVPVPGATVTVTIANNPGNSSIGQPSTTTNVNGLGAMNISIPNPGVGYTLLATANAAGFSPGTAISNAFDITAPLTMNQTLPDAFEQSAYSANVGASGGLPPYTYSSTGSLPAGLSFNSATGAFSGTPSEVNFTLFTVTVTDTANGSVSKTYNVQSWAPQSAYCVAGTFPIFNNWNTGNVSNNAASPTVLVPNRPNGYAVTGMANYHTNNSQVTPTITLGNISPFAVTINTNGVTPGFANWEATVPGGTNLLFGQYPVLDSDQAVPAQAYPGTWMQNAQSGGKGFTVVCVKPN